MPSVDQSSGAVVKAVRPQFSARALPVDGLDIIHMGIVWGGLFPWPGINWNLKVELLLV